LIVPRLTRLFVPDCMRMAQVQVDAVGLKRSGEDLFPGCDYRSEALSIVVVGASGDLARKKTYPSLFDLYLTSFLPAHAKIVGYARSKMSDEEFRGKIRPTLEKKKCSPEVLEGFLETLSYRSGKYDSEEDVAALHQYLEELETAAGKSHTNRLFYFAIPPSVFSGVGGAIKNQALVSGQRGWNRLVIEKPFGRDLESFEKLNSVMKGLFHEDQIYRIDHYLGKEMVQNILTLRFANSIYEPVWNRNYINSVTFTFKEDFGTAGRGGYFDEFGIIRDVMQNHLLQVLCIIAMEPPYSLKGKEGASSIRGAKVNVLKSIEPLRLDETVLGQYVADDVGKNPGYTEDETVPNGSLAPTFATTVFHINNTRWDGVPFIMKAGKALNEKKSEVRIQFGSPPGCSAMFDQSETVVRNELVLRMQPNEAIYLVMNMKSPGLDERTVSTELDLTYSDRYKELSIPDAYTRLLIEVLRGRQSTFVRDDELREAWKIFTPLLKEIEDKKIKPIPYKFGSRGPKESDNLIHKFGYRYHAGKYKWEGAKQSNL